MTGLSCKAKDIQAIQSGTEVQQPSSIPFSKPRLLLDLTSHTFFFFLGCKTMTFSADLSLFPLIIASSFPSLA